MADLCQAPSPRPRVYRWQILLHDLCCFPGPVMYVTLQGVSTLPAPSEAP